MKMKNLLDKLNNKIEKFKGNRHYSEIIGGLYLTSFYGFVNVGEAVIGIEPNITKTLRGNPNVWSFIWGGIFADSLASIISGKHHYLLTKPFDFSKNIYKKLRDKK